MAIPGAARVDDQVEDVGLSTRRAAQQRLKGVRLECQEALASRCWLLATSAVESAALLAGGGAVEIVHGQLSIEFASGPIGRRGGYEGPQRGETVDVVLGLASCV